MQQVDGAVKGFTDGDLGASQAIALTMAGKLIFCVLELKCEML